ncbi:MAG TPA: hypothetical protein VK186_01265 [Candidatus Deferrimicrobium sp.]|nr:hypothetical protein [Candidatus Deferrimicrobium sp.]
MKTKQAVYLFVSYLFVALILFCLTCTPLECRANQVDKANETANAKTGTPANSVNFDIKRLEKALDGVAEIGAGRNFLTLMVDLPQRLPAGYQLYAMALDRDEVPLRKISSYTFDPEIKNKNHIWFYFFLFVPGGPRHELRPTSTPPSILHSYAGDYLKFILVKGEETIIEKVIPRYDEWGNEKTPLIMDIPLPPQEIPGYLELGDFTFLARGDYRKPERYYVEGKIVGGAGTWNYFEPTSDILGQEREPEIKLASSQGWIELKTGKTHQMNEAVAPISPYVNGWWDGKGFFHPQPAKIQ